MMGTGHLLWAIYLFSKLEPTERKYILIQCRRICLWMAIERLSYNRWRRWRRYRRWNLSCRFLLVGRFLERKNNLLTFLSFSFVPKPLWQENRHRAGWTLHLPKHSCPFVLNGKSCVYGQERSMVQATVNWFNYTGDSIRFLVVSPSPKLCKSQAA